MSAPDIYNIENNIGSWRYLGNVLTFLSTDTPTFVATTSIDLTSILSLGMRIKLTQTSTKYFIITAISGTTLTLYGGTDYTLINAAITNVYYSGEKAPYGFPLNPEKWTMNFIIAGASQTNPVAGTWYNLANIIVHAGSWKLPYNIALNGYKASTTAFKQYFSLSTTNNGVTDNERTSYIQIEGATGIMSDNMPVYNTKDITITSKTTYYLNTMTPLSAVNSIGIGEAGSIQTVKAICNYL